MQSHVKYLIIENEENWATALGDSVNTYFRENHRFVRERIRDHTALVPRQMRQQVSEGGWDLVLLDLNLGDSAAKAKLSGLNLLGEIAAGNKAYFVIIVTGAVTDPSLERLYGAETAAMMKFGALNEAVRRLPAARVRILHKPDVMEAAEAMKTLRPHLFSALDQYCAVSRERNIFRPLPEDPGLWEICYNGGPRLYLKHAEPYKMTRSALARPNDMLKVIRLMQALANSSGKAEATAPVETDLKPHRKGTSDLDYRGHQDDEVNAADGLAWEEMVGFSIIDGTPIDTDEGAIPIETLIGGLLLAQARKLNLDTVIKDYVESYGERVILSLPAIAAKWANRREAANRQFNIEDAPVELIQLATSLRTLLGPMRDRWLNNESQPRREDQPRVAQGMETPELRLARQHWLRFKKYIGRRPALAEFREHMIQWIDRSPTAKGHLYYRSPGGGDLCPFWLTD
jgi:hypothetical protein